MIILTDKAKQEFTDFLEGRGDTTVRIHLVYGGCGGMKLSLAFEEAQEDEISMKIDGITFAIDQALVELAGEIYIDHEGYGFSLDSKHPVGDGKCRVCAATGRPCQSKLNS